MKFGNIFVGKRLFVGCGKPEALGKGETEIRGSGYVEGPLQVGTDTDFASSDATLMVGHEYNSDSETHPTTSLHVKGDVQIDGDNNIDGSSLKITGDTNQTGSTNQTGNITLSGRVDAEVEVTAGGGADRLTNKKDKPFDMPHPNKKGWRLRHVCLEGPEIAVYVRGRVHNRDNVITLPEYWDGLVNYETMTVQLTPIHSHQNVIVKRIDVNERKIHLQAQGGMPVDCFYYVMAQRVDDDLIVEYEGESAEDYPGGNEGYSFNWENDNMERLVKEVARERLKELEG